MQKKNMGTSNQYGTDMKNTRLARAKTNSSAVTPNESFNGIGSDIYGGHSARGTVNSFINQYNKYFAAATGGRTQYDASKVSNRMFNQLMIMDRSTLQQIQPFIPGRFIFVPGEMPRCMEILHPVETEYMRTMFQTAVTSITGFSSRTLDASKVQAMTDQNSYEVITKQSGATTRLTFTFMTLFRGLPIYKYITSWMQYIYSAGSSAAVYPHYTGLEYHEGSHSMNGVYAIIDPSFQLVEEAALIYSMVPLDNGAENILSQTWGNHDVQSGYNVNFKCHTLSGGMPQVIRMAQAVLADYVGEVELHDYWVNPANNPADPAGQTMGLGPSLYGPNGIEEARKVANIELGPNPGF